MHGMTVTMCSKAPVILGGCSSTDLFIANPIDPKKAIKSNIFPHLCSLLWRMADSAFHIKHKLLTFYQILTVLHCIASLTTQDSGHPGTMSPAP